MPIGRSAPMGGAQRSHPSHLDTEPSWGARRVFSRDRDRPSIDGYEDCDLIGRGGFSHFYRALQPAFDRRVALKVITATIEASDLDRFSDELQRTPHPAVVNAADITCSGVTPNGQCVRRASPPPTAGWVGWPSGAACPRSLPSGGSE